MFECLSAEQVYRFPNHGALSYVTVVFPILFRIDRRWIFCPQNVYVLCLISELSDFPAASFQDLVKFNFVGL